MFAYGIICDKFKTLYRFLIMFFLEDISIMNLFKYLLLFGCFSIVFADSYLAQDGIEDSKEIASEEAIEDAFAAIDFKDEYLFSVNFGSTIPFGQNLKNHYEAGINIKLNVLTPFGFTVLNKDFKLLAGLDIMQCTANENNEYGDYGVISFGTSLVTNISVIDISMGTGLATSSGTWSGDSMTTAYISAGISYTLPLSGLFQKSDLGNLNFDISNLSIAIFVEGTEIFGAPASVGTSDLINAGLSMGYPVLF